MHCMSNDKYNIIQYRQIGTKGCDRYGLLARNPDIGPKSYLCLPKLGSFHLFKDSFLTCEPYGASLHFSSSCHALLLHPPGSKLPQALGHSSSIPRVPISPSRSQRYSFENPSNVTMSGPRPQTERQTDETHACQI